MTTATVRIGDGTPELTSWRLSATRPATPLTLAYRPAGAPAPRRHRPVWFPGYGEVAADVYDRSALPPGWSGRGPALFEERDTCCAVGPGCAVTVDGQHSLVIDIDISSGKEAAR